MTRADARLGCTARMGCTYLIYTPIASSANLPALVNHAYLPTHLFSICVSKSAIMPIYLSVYPSSS